MLEVLHTESGLSLLGWRDVFVVVWRNTPAQATLQRMATELNAFAARHPAGVAMIVVIEEGLPMPEGAVRERMARDMKRHDSFTRSMALVFEGQGFVAALVRATVAGLHLLSRQVVPAQVFATVEEAAWWVTRIGLAERARPEDLAAAVRDARAAARLVQRAS